MNVPNATALRHHIFSSEDFILTPVETQRQLSTHSTLYEATNINTNKISVLNKTKLIFC